MALKGIDVSKYQGNIDWAAVRNSGIEFAMLRGGYGRYNTQKDGKFEQNYNGAKSVGMPIGAYHYSYATSVAAAEQEADFCLSYLAGKSFEYPIIIDVEEKRQSNLGKAALTQVVDAFCSKIANAGYLVGIYASKSFFQNYLDMNILGKYEVWVAQWASACTYSGEYGLWQYTSDGSVPGIAGRIDMNYGYKDYPTIIKSAGLNGFASDAPQPAPQPAPKPEAPARQYAHGIGEDVVFSACYKSSTDPASKAIPASKMLRNHGKITRILDAANPYLLDAGLCWVNDAGISGPYTGAAAPAPKPSTSAGSAINLKNRSLYVSATAAKAVRKISGTYYFYDDKTTNGRRRITTSPANCGKKPIGNYVTGWISI